MVWFYPVRRTRENIIDYLMLLMAFAGELQVSYIKCTVLISYLASGYISKKSEQNIHTTQKNNLCIRKINNQYSDPCVCCRILFRLQTQMKRTPPYIYIYIYKTDAPIKIYKLLHNNQLQQNKQASQLPVCPNDINNANIAVAVYTFAVFNVWE